MMAKEIQLSQRKIAIVDDADFEWLSQWKWSAAKRGKRQITWYAVRMTKKAEPPPGKLLLMHREILKPADGLVTDHINGDGLDNRRANLRACTQAQNCLNYPVRSRKIGKYKGSYWHSDRSIWCASFRGGHLGVFSNEVDAARAYDRVAYEHDPEFALLNFPAGG